MDKIDVNTLNKMYETRELKEIIDTLKKLIKIIYIERIISTKNIEEFESFNPENINMNVNKNHKKLLIEYKENLEQIKKLSIIQNMLKYNKEELIIEIKKQIEKLNESNFLRLKEIISEEKINKEALSFALELLENTIGLKIEIQIIKEEKEQIEEYETSKTLLKNIIKNKEQLSLLLEQLIELENKSPEKSIFRLPKYLKEKQIKQQEKLELIKKIIKIIYEDYEERENEALKVYCFEQLTNIKIIHDKLRISKLDEFDINNCKKIKKQLEKEFETVIEYITKKIQKEKIKQEKLSNKTHDEKIREYIYHRKNNYVHYILDIINLNKNKENTLFYKIIIVLKILYQIENNNYDMINNLMPKSTYEIDLLKTLTCDIRDEQELKETIEIQNQVLNNLGVKTIRK